MIDEENMEFKDYYKTMGVSSDASQEDIKRAYRKLARKYHPDVSKEEAAEAKFKELGEAYEVLKDPEKRSRYDLLRQQGYRGGESFRTPPNWQQEFYQGGAEEGSQYDGDFSDFFESLFGHRYRGRPSGAGFGRAPTKGEDIYYVLNTDLADSYSGGTRRIEFPVTEVNTEGLIQRKNRAVNVKIPKGVVSGQKIRLRGQGGPGINNGPPGDLYLEIQLIPRKPFQVEGKDISIVLPVTPWEAALGAKVKAPTLGGDIEIKVPPNTPTGTKLRLKERGLPGKPPGDQYVILQVATPPATTELAKELYKQMAEKIPFNPRQKLGM